MSAAIVVCFMGAALLLGFALAIFSRKDAQ